MAAPSLPSFTDTIVAVMPALAADCVSRTRDALRQSSADLALAHDRARVFVAAEALLNHGKHLESALCQALQTELASAGRRSQAAQKPTELPLDEVGLVDENQAETEIVLAQIVQMIDLKADWELREMDAFMATLMGQAEGSPRDHPFQPARFAAALSSSFATLGLAPEEKRLLLRVAGGVLADLLKQVYANACVQLRQSGLKPQPFRVKVERAHPVASAAAPAAVPAAGASLQTLLQKFPAEAPAPSASASAAAPPAPVMGAREAPASSGLSITFKAIDLAPQDPSFVRSAARPASDDQIQAMMGALFQELGADAQVPQGVKALIGQLQPCLQKAARSDRSLLASTQHPAWRFINELAQHACGYAQTDPSTLQRLIAHVQPVVVALDRSALPGKAAFEAANRVLQRFVEDRSRHAWQQQANALSSLQSADQRLTLEPVVRQQLAARLSGLTIDAQLRGFLLSTWVKVLTRLLADGQPEDARKQSLLNTVEDLLQCMDPPPVAAERAALRNLVPHLVQRLRDGMSSIELPAPQQQVVLDRVTQVLAACLAGGTPAGHIPAAPAAMAVSETGRHDPWGDSELEGGHEALPSLGMDTNIGALPTVPMALGSAGGPGRAASSSDDETAHVRGTSPAEWAASLQVGAWLKLSWQGQWATAQLLWISGNREFLVFKRSHVLQLQSISRKALERLRAEGLATQLEERKLVQRAVDSLLLQDI
jgi:hypothetical protein